MILDVREQIEVDEEYIPDSISCPLSQLSIVAPSILKDDVDKDVTVICSNGVRSQLAIEELKKNDKQNHKFSVYAGGILKWKQDGKPIISVRDQFPIIRQVHLVASLIILVAFLGYFFAHPNFIYLAMLVGFGLALDGLTGFCPMTKILSKLPWNKNRICDPRKGCCA